MSVDRDVVAARLDLIAAKAKILAAKYRGNQLWEGELTTGLNDIQTEVQAVQRESGDNQYYGR
jgi:hypothetical protein